MNKQEILKRLQALELKVKKLEIEAESKKLEGLFVGPGRYPGYGPQNPVVSWDARVIDGQR